MGQGIRIGQTHTSRLVSGACSICGLGHLVLPTADACLAMRDASSVDEERVAWAALKAAVAAAERGDGR